MEYIYRIVNHIKKEAIEAVKNCADMKELEELEEELAHLQEAIKEQKELIKGYENEKVLYMYYLHHLKSVIITKGSKAELDICGYLTKQENVEAVELRRLGTKKSKKVVGELVEKFKPYKICDTLLPELS